MNINVKDTGVEIVESIFEQVFNHCVFPEINPPDLENKFHFTL